MSVEAPDRIRVAQDSDGFWTCREAVSGSQEYVRADLFHDLEKQHARCRDRSVVVSIGDVGYYVSQGVADKLEELAAENERLNSDSLKVGDQMLAEKFRADKAEAALAEAKRENEVLREALYYYAGSSCGDGGDLAREVLARNAGGKDG